MTANAAGPPPTRVDNANDTLHGVKVADPYRWLEDQDAPETRRWIEAQMKYTRSLLDPLPGRDRINKRLADLIRADRVGLPRSHGGRYFFLKRAAGQEQWVLLTREGLTGADVTLVDPNTLSRDASVSVNLPAVSNDGKLLVYGLQQGGKDEQRLRVMDVVRREILADELPEEKYISVAFSGDNKRIFYSISGRENPRVREHRLGTPASEDREIFGQGLGLEHIIACDVSEDGRWLIIHVYLGSTGEITEVYVKDLAAGADARVTPVVKGIKAVFQGEIAQDRLYLLTNWNALNSRILVVDLHRPEQANWKEIVPESAAALQGFSLAGGRIHAQYLENVQSRIKIFAPDGAFEKEIPLPAIGTVSNVSGQFSKKEAFYSFASFHFPTQIMRLDTETGKQEVWSKLNVPLDPGTLELKQVWFNSKDGTRVPMFLLHKKGLARDGNRPVYLTGYGGFNVPVTPSFSATAVTWAEHGGIFAMANLRGGSEFGEKWHREGMLLNKQNVFDDFIAAAEFLIKEKYTKPARLAISGGSNGGLLVGAAITQRPELFGAAVCSYPLLDMVRYHKFLVAKFWVPEYGSSDDPGQFRYLLGYSPYHNVKKGAKYPPIMFVTGDGDTRVAPLHGRKMAALLQANTGGSGPVLLHYDIKAGHSGGMSATKTIDDTTDQLSFLFWQLGVTPGK